MRANDAAVPSALVPPLCVVCGAPFERQAPNQKSCPLACSEELRRQRKARSKSGQMSAPRHECACDYCGAAFTPNRSTARFCCKHCRVSFHRGIPSVSPTGHAAVVEAFQAEAEAGLNKLKAQHRRYFPRESAAFSQALLAAGLPANRVLAAAVLGISATTIVHRLRRGTPLLSPLRRDRRAGRLAPVPLRVPKPDDLDGFVVRETPLQQLIREHQSSHESCCADLQDNSTHGLDGLS